MSISTKKKVFCICAFEIKYFCSQTIFFGAIFFKPQVLDVKRSFLRFLSSGSHDGDRGGGYKFDSPLKFTPNTTISTMVFGVNFKGKSKLYSRPKKNFKNERFTSSTCG